MICMSNTITLNSSQEMLSPEVYPRSHQMTPKIAVSCISLSFYIRKGKPLQILMCKGGHSGLHKYNNNSIDNEVLLHNLQQCVTLGEKLSS